MFQILYNDVAVRFVNIYKMSERNVFFISESIVDTES